MSNNFDSFYDDMIKDIKPAASDPKEINMNELGAKMEKAVKEAYERGLKAAEAAVKQEPKEPDEPKEPEEPTEPKEPDEPKEEDN